MKIFYSNFLHSVNKFIDFVSVVELQYFLLNKFLSDLFVFNLRKLVEFLNIEQQIFLISFNNIILFGVSEKSHFGFFVFCFGLSIFDSLGVFHNIVKNHFLLSILYQVKVLIFQDIFFLFGFIFNIFFSLFSAYRSYRISSRLGGKFLFILWLVFIVVFLKLFSQVSSR